MDMKPRQSNDPIQLIPDLAVAELHNDRYDSLEFSTYADVVARITRGTRGPFTIGVFGEWGMGKTSLMRLIERNVEQGNTKDSLVIPVWFNAWMFERVEYPIIPLLKGLIEALKERESAITKLGHSAGALITALESLVLALKLKGKISLPGGDVEMEFSPQAAATAFTRLRDDGLVPDNPDSYEQIFRALNAISDKVVPHNITIMVLIDDLDRCFPENAVRLLESIKLILSQPGFVFALGASRVVIEEYLQSKYEKQYGIAHFDGRSYLDKMIQLTFDIPPHTSRINSFTKDIIESLRDTSTKRELRPISTVIGSVCQYNPRTIIRFINRLITDSAIYRLKNSTTTTPIGVFAVTRSLQQTWRDAYGLLVSGDSDEDHEYCAIVAEWSETDLRDWATYDSEPKINPNGSIDKGTQRIIYAIKKLKMADPDGLRQIAIYMLQDRTLRSLMFGKIGRQWLTNHTLREASISFLSTQPIPTTDPATPAETTGELIREAFDITDTESDDIAYQEAVEMVILAKKASTSMLQRRMGIGYGRAARLIERMEQEGIVSKFDGSNAREVLIKRNKDVENK